MKHFNLSSTIALWTLSLGPCSAFAQPAQGPQTMVNRLMPARPRVLATGPNQQVMQDLLDFVDLLNTGQIFPDGQKWIYGARPGFFGANQWARESNLSQMKPAGITLQIVNLTVVKIDAATATATATYVLVPPAGVPIPEEAVAFLLREGVETLQLKLGVMSGVAAKKWQIVPPDFAPQPKIGDVPDEFDHLFARASFALAQKSDLKLSNEPAKVSMSRLKQLSLGVLMFAQDYDERIAFAPEYLQEAIFPYVKSKELFLVPGTQEAFSFNANLSDKNLADVKEPSKIVMFYEGENEKPTFRYGGQAVIGYVDGHIKLVSPDEAKDLIWKP